jgi:hypothetical protein
MWNERAPNKKKKGARKKDKEERANPCQGSLMMNDAKSIEKCEMRQNCKAVENRKDCREFPDSPFYFILRQNTRRQGEFGQVKHDFRVVWCRSQRFRVFGVFALNALLMGIHFLRQLSWVSLDQPP